MNRNHQPSPAFLAAVVDANAQWAGCTDSGLLRHTVRCIKDALSCAPQDASPFTEALWGQLSVLLDVQQSLARSRRAA